LGERTSLGGVAGEVRGYSENPAAVSEMVQRLKERLAQELLGELGIRSALTAVETHVCFLPGSQEIEKRYFRG
jgi:hypothetical protein